VRLLAAAVAAVTAVRLAVSARVPLAPDETYYWIWSHALAGGYLDHPPMVALWIRAGTLAAGQTALGVRLLGPLAAGAASWLLFDAARRLFPATNAGVVAVVLLNASLLLGVGSVIMTPDSPLLFFWTATFWATARLSAGGSGWWWLAAGLAGGLALDSKYTALLLWIGIGLWVVLVPAMRPWLRRWQPWAACGIGLAVFVPVLAWNAANGWAGLARQGGRVEDWRPARAIGLLGELVGGQVGLATPLIFGLCAVGLVVATRRAWRRRDPGWSLLTALSLPPIILFVQHAIGDRVQGNWPAIIYPALTVAAGATQPDRRWWTGAAALGCAMTALAYFQAVTELIPLPRGLDPVAMRLAGWGGLADRVAAVRRDVAADFVVADGYALTSELAWWMPEGVEVLGTEARWRLLRLPEVQIGGREGLLVAPPGRVPDGALWDHAEPVGSAERSGSNFVLYRVTARPDTRAMVLPRSWEAR
jgi:4-amino-4-deoxy-L-arabinose transferase-like glycosyltransferase